MAQPTRKTKPKPLTGFALMKARDPKGFTILSRKAGRRAHKLGVAHEWTDREARRYAPKGGQARGKR